MKHLLIFLGLFLISLVGQAQNQWSADFAIGTHGIGTPFHNFPASRGGFMMSGESHIRLGDLDRNSYFKLGLNISFFRHKDLKNSILLMPIISYRLGIGSVFIEPSFALGYSGSVLQIQSFEPDGSGNFKTKKGRWLSAFVAQPRLRLGAKINDQMDIFTQYTFQIEGFYKAMPVVPFQSIQLGTSFHFK
ncbi:MAG: hypothetical protein MUE85_18285 [Microscillaceae bacterium]|jgi:hypothetical protein|nr:hypothetical protein [Microscillaceae bacterium]